MDNLHLYWQDRNWKVRGYANNFNLVVDFKKKVFYTFTNCYFGYDQPTDIEVVRKSDIYDYMNELKRNGFILVKNSEEMRNFKN